MEEFSRWLSSYGNAWKSGDTEGIQQLFSKEARYYETPFDPPLIGRKSIAEYWDEGAKHGQKEVSFSSKGAAVSGNRGFSRWNASFIRVQSEVSVRIEGFLEAQFDEDGLCSVFREWWHRRENN